MVNGMTIILTFIISVIGYYVAIKLIISADQTGWVNGYRNSWLQLSFILVHDGKGQG